MAKILSLTIVILSVLGLLNAGYITWNKINDIIPPCQPPFACDTVLESNWASIGPIPLSALGLFFYGAFLILGAIQLLEIPVITLGARKFSSTAAICILGVIGLLFSLYLIAIMGIVLQAWCLYCILSAVDCLLLFVASSLLYVLKRGSDS